MTQKQKLAKLEEILATMEAQTALVQKLAYDVAKESGQLHEFYLKASEVFLSGKPTV
jgi:hypothetical protein